jgi:hypothetical protein
MVLAWIEFGTHLHRRENLAQDKLQGKIARIGIGEHDRMVANGLGGFAQRTMRLLPASHHKYPMLDQQPNEFGIDFAEHPPRIVRAPLIQQAILLPLATLIKYTIASLR